MDNYLVSNNNRRVLNKDKLKKDLSNKTLEEIKNTYYDLISGYEAILVKLDKKSQDYKDYSKIISDLNTIFKETKTTKESTKTLLDFYDEETDPPYKKDLLVNYLQFPNLYKGTEPKMSVKELKQLRDDFDKQIGEIITEYRIDIYEEEKDKNKPIFIGGIMTRPNKTNRNAIDRIIKRKEEELLRKRTAHAYIKQVIGIIISRLEKKQQGNIIRELRKPKLKKIIQSKKFKDLLKSNMFRNLKF
jgi:hypothetical protein